MIVPDHATPIRVKTHTSDLVPFLIYSSLRQIAGSAHNFCEAAVKDSSLYFKEGFRLMDFFIAGG